MTVQRNQFHYFSSIDIYEAPPAPLTKKAIIIKLVNILKFNVTFFAAVEFLAGDEPKLGSDNAGIF
jgi:hypothetical protein